MLNQRRLGKSDLHFTTLGIGTWAIGGGDWKFGWGQQDESEAIAAVVVGVRAGINWVDTAAVYGAGRSEELVGKARRELGSADRPYIATKCGRIIQPDWQRGGAIDTGKCPCRMRCQLATLGHRLYRPLSTPLARSRCADRSRLGDVAGIEASRQDSRTGRLESLGRADGAAA